MQKKEFIGILLSIFTAFTFGLGAILGKILFSQGLYPLFVSFWCLLIGLVSFLIFLFIKRTNPFIYLTKKNVSDFLLSSVLGLGIGFIIINSGLKYTTGVKGGFFIQMQIIAITLFGWVLLKEKLKAIDFLGLFLTVIGALLVVVGKISFVKTLLTFNSGDLLVFIGASLMGFGYIPTKKLTKTIDSNVVASLRLFLATLTALAILPLPGVIPNRVPSFSQILILFVFGFSNFFLGYLTLHKSFNFLPAWKIGLVLQSIPFFSTIFAILLLSESITLLQIIGGIVMVIGGSIINIKK
jgi:drug/metabolite transporter (DMT)-like permease